MRLADAIAMAASSLSRNPLRSALTALGIVIGVAGVIAMVAVGAGAKHEIHRSIQSMGSNILLVINGSRTAAGKEIGQGNFLTLSEGDARAIAQNIPEVQVAAGSVAGAGQVVFGNKNWSTILRGVTPEYFVARNWSIIAGRNMRPDEIRSAAKVALIGQTVAEELFDGIGPIGQTVRVKHAPFKIIGVMAAKGPAPWGADQDDVLYMPLSTAKKRLFGGRQQRGDLLGQITVKAISAEAIPKVHASIADILRQRHGLRPHEPSDFFVRNLSELLRARADSARVMALLLASVAGISLLVGGIGIMNVMLVSVSERTREIGLRMAVGAKPSEIRLQFILEALLLAIFGGSLGIGLGIAGSVTIAALLDWPILIGPEAIAIAVFFTAAVGLFFGYYPARRASRLDPIDALRQD